MEVFADMLAIADKILLAVLFLSSVTVLFLVVNKMINKKNEEDERLRKLMEEPEYDETIDYLS